MRLISWNVNGIRAAIRKGLDEFIKKTGLTKIWFADTYKMSNGYERYTVIGNHRT